MKSQKSHSRVVFEIPEVLHFQFKIHALKKGMHMKDLFIQLIQKELQRKGNFYPEERFTEGE